MAKNLQSLKNYLDQAIEVNISSAILYAFSPIANITELENGNYLITITDKQGTTTAQIPVFTEETIEHVLDTYFTTKLCIMNGGNAFTEFV